MFYKSFFYECLVNLYFKKKYFLGAFQGQIYFKARASRDVRMLKCVFTLSPLDVSGLTNSMEEESTVFSPQNFWPLNCTVASTDTISWLAGTNELQIK